MFLNGSVIIISIKTKSMNLKERGVTVGDLIIFLIIIISTILIINKVKDSNKQIQSYITPLESSINIVS